MVRAGADETGLPAGGRTDFRGAKRGGAKVPEFGVWEASRRLPARENNVLCVTD